MKMRILKEMNNWGDSKNRNIIKKMNNWDPYISRRKMGR